MRCRIALIILLGSFASSAVAQISKLPHRPAGEAFFGSAVAISGHTAAVGASGENVCGEHSGAVYLFERDAGTGIWGSAQRVTCEACRPNEFFGRDIALSDRVLVAASGTEFFAREHPNVAHVFERQDDGSWREVAHLQPDEPSPGTYATAVDADDGRIVVVEAGARAGSSHAGATYVYERDAEGQWQQTARITPVRPSSASGDAFGGSAAIAGDRIIVAAPSASARRDGAVYIFEQDPASKQWLQRARIGRFSGAALAVDIMGDHALVGDHQRGAVRRGEVRLLRRDEQGGWHVQQQLNPSVSSQSGAFGTAVALERERALVVGFDEQLDQEYNIDRVVFVFEPDATDGAWHQRHVIDIGETEFGASLDSDDGFAIVGSSGDRRPGAAYVVRIH